MNVKLLFLGLFALILFLGLGVALYQHETTHVQINKYAGVDSHIEFNFTGAVTVPDEDFASKELYSQAYISHGINEAIGYQIIPLIVMVCATLCLCTIYLGNLLEVKN